MDMPKILPDQSQKGVWDSGYLASNERITKIHPSKHRIARAFLFLLCVYLDLGMVYMLAYWVDMTGRKYGSAYQYSGSLLVRVASGDTRTWIVC